MMYEGFAEIYDALMSDVDYAVWANHYQALFAHMGVSAKRVLDCACGTGGMTFALQALGYQTTGSDASIEMLSKAAEKARRLGIAIPFVRQDLRKLQTHRAMDAIVCACDGVNYLLKPNDARAFFASAFQALRPGGGLFFDISSRYKLENVLGYQTYGEDRGDICYLWQNRYNSISHIIHMDLTFFTKQPDGRYACFRETHNQRAYETDELLVLLAEAGFSRAVAYGGMSMLPPAAESERIHFAAVRVE
ncbi:MAG: class I SAM-dependent methyltransferase [Oscillospiraceae bacterium]|jgi:SAM-dependent methyltransferase|nr:class I SAM-dependent methyltransferase [Oscillospiraceae bacterium]